VRREGRGEVEVDGSPAGERRRYYHPEQKDYATFLETSEETGGERTLIEIEVAPGGDDPDDRQVFTMSSNEAGVKRLTNNLDAHDASPNEHRRPYAHPSLPSRGGPEAAFRRLPLPEAAYTPRRGGHIPQMS
jgi:hypothetical protein